MTPPPDDPRRSHPGFTDTEPPTAARRARALGVKIPPPTMPKIAESTEEAPVSKNTERLRQVAQAAQAFGWEAFFSGLTKFVGAIAVSGVSIAGAALSLRPLIAEWKAPAPLVSKDIARIEELEKQLAKTTAEREQIAAWAIEIRRNSAGELNTQRRIQLLGEAVSCVNGKKPGPDWPRCDDEKWHKRNRAQGYDSDRAW